VPPPPETPLRRRLRHFRYLVLEVVYWPLSMGLLIAAIFVLPPLAVGADKLGGPQYLAAVHRLARRAHTAAGGSPARLEVAPTDLGEPQARQDLWWLLLHATVGFAVAVVVASLALNSVLYVVLAPLWWAFPSSVPLSLLFTVDSWPRAWWTIGLGVLYGVLAWVLLPWAAGRVARVTRSVLEPRRAAVLERRVTELSASRAAALDAHAAELRRIERELHDGAQNRLVSVVMMLGMAHRALETDAAKALPLLERAQEAAGEALAGLRTAVHDIYPPVLDELGLGDAASALTSRSTIPCSLDVTGLRRAPAAVESAAYFVLAEALTNALKHSEASHIAVSLHTTMRDDEELLVVEVRDDGRGGATEGGRGSGLSGIARRAAAFEGALHLTSPVGGPTTVRVELPCGF